MRRFEPPAALLDGLGVEADGRLQCLHDRGVHVPGLDEGRIARLWNRKSSPQGTPRRRRWRIRDACGRRREKCRFALVPGGSESAGCAKAKGSRGLTNFSFIYSVWSFVINSCRFAGVLNIYMQNIYSMLFFFFIFRIGYKRVIVVEKEKIRSRNAVKADIYRVL